VKTSRLWSQNLGEHPPWLLGDNARQQNHFTFLAEQTVTAKSVSSHYSRKKSREHHNISQPENILPCRLQLHPEANVSNHISFLII
jgi:hypothetical protein